MTIFNLVENKGEYISESTIFNDNEGSLEKLKRATPIKENMTHIELNDYYKSIQTFGDYKPLVENESLEEDDLEESAFEKEIRLNEAISVIFEVLIGFVILIGTIFIILFLTDGFPWQ